jgi:hypothetical protein
VDFSRCKNTVLVHDPVINDEWSRMLPVIRRRIFGNLTRTRLDIILLSARCLWIALDLLPHA